MKKRTRIYAIGGALAVAAAGALVASGAFSSETTVAALAKETHFHGLAVDAGEPSRLYLATHHGVYVVDAKGKAKRVSTGRDDFMGFTPHPTDRSILYASGHPATGGNLGFVASTDGGKSWRKHSEGLGGPVDFHQMDVSKADPNVIYGIYGALQRSADGGRTWTRVGPSPEGVISLAASSKNADTVYAATQTGLIKSADGGRSWQPAYPSKALATMVHVTHGGDLYAFVAGTGLLRAAEAGSGWRIVSNDFRGDYVLHFAADPGDAKKLYAITVNPGTHAAALLASRDGGASWAALGK